MLRTHLVELVGFEPTSPPCKGGALPSELKPQDFRNGRIRTYGPSVPGRVRYPCATFRYLVPVRFELTLYLL